MEDKQKKLGAHLAWDRQAEPQLYWEKLARPSMASAGLLRWLDSCLCAPNPVSRAWVPCLGLFSFCFLLKTSTQVSVELKGKEFVQTFREMGMVEGEEQLPRGSRPLLEKGVGAEEGKGCGREGPKEEVQALVREPCLGTKPHSL